MGIVVHLLTELHEAKVATRPSLPLCGGQANRLAYREPRTISEELAEMDGRKSKLEERTHYEGIPLCMIRQTERVPAARAIKTSKRILSLEKAMGCLQVHAASVSSTFGARRCSQPLTRQTDMRKAADVRMQEGWAEESEESDDEDDVVLVFQ
jgi:hypothetical protein